MIWFYVLIFIISCVLLYFAGEFLVKGLTRIAKFLGWKEFVVAFLLIAFASSLPNLSLGVSSALHGVPQLSFGDVLGNNMIAMTLAVGLAAFFSRDGITGNSQTIQTTAVFVLVSAILPLLLVADGILSRIDGVLLISFFGCYLYWLFSKKERFSRVYNNERDTQLHFGISNFFKDISRVLLGVIFVIIAAEGIVRSSAFFASTFNLPLVLIGIFVTGAGNALPEIYFSIVLAKRGHNWMILGGLMGAVIIPATLVLGIVSLIHPIEIANFSYGIIARLFLIIASLFFFFSVLTGKKITRKEALVLLGIYIVFILTEIAMGIYENIK
ncbi:sodium:calcium antiporter [Patescibacteria group bacterium]|nr:sodium:calcium antiporter [Patescibacteria group bacterium]MBU4000046.1 sodium:calcium antiporter [Patescibacteria group bacterium]MBU4056302.1 sodium:calcium antiporter [Patescibacteria group bacterium]MBU4368295.1 sodium:calcium antiporter [Patescibacteria group bacterium]